jgi:hypothetical protein
MRRILLALLLQASVLLAGCGAVSVGFVSNPGGAPVSISGVVVAVHIGSANDVSGKPVTFTAVTFSNVGLANTVNFCGDEQGQFQLNQSMRADYRPGTVCSTLVVVVAL